MPVMEDSFHLGIKALIKNDDGQVLLFKINSAELITNPHGEYWDLPGGRIQRNSTAAETLRREVEEETGVKNVSVGKHLGMVLSNIRIPLKDGQDVGLVLSIYECKLPSDANIRLSFEHLAFEWFKPAEAAKHLATKYPNDFCQLIAKL